MMEVVELSKKMKMKMTDLGLDVRGFGSSSEVSVTWKLHQKLVSIAASPS